MLKHEMKSIKKYVEKFQLVCPESKFHTYGTPGTPVASSKLDIIKPTEDYFYIRGMDYAITSMAHKKNIYFTKTTADSYDMTIYAKNEIKNFNTKEKIFKKMLEKSEYNLEDFYENHKFSKVKEITSIYNVDYFMMILGNNTPQMKSILQKNYEEIIRRTFRNLDRKKEIIATELCSYMFDHSQFYTTDVVNVIVDGIRKMFKQKNIVINETILRHLLTNAMTYRNTDTFGVVYQTIDYISNVTGVSRMATMNSIRKLEYLGIISGVVRDMKGRNQDVEKCIESASDDVTTEGRLKAQYKPEKRECSNIVFPLINFEKLLDFVPDMYLNNIFDRAMDSLSEKASKKIIREMVKYISTRGMEDGDAMLKKAFSEFDIIGVANAPVSEKINNEIDYTVQIDLVQTAKERLSQYTGEFELCKPVELQDNFRNYFTAKPNTMSLSNVIEDYYLVSTWFSDKLKLEYNCRTGKGIKRIDKKRMFEFIDRTDLEEIFDKKMTMMYTCTGNKEDFEDGIKSLLKKSFDAYRCGMIESIKKRDGLGKINTFKLFDSDKDKARIEMGAKKVNLTVSNFFYVSTLMKSVVEKPGTKFHLYEVVKAMYEKSFNKKQFLKDMYTAFVKTNKNPYYITNNVSNLIKSYRGGNYAEGSQSSKVA